MWCVRGESMPVCMHACMTVWLYREYTCLESVLGWWELMVVTVQT